MNLQFVKAGTADALTLNGISKRAFDSDVEVGASSAGGPPGYMSVPFYTKMARSKDLYGEPLKSREGDKNKNYIWKISDSEKLQLDGGASSDGEICSFAITKTEKKK